MNFRTLFRSAQCFHSNVKTASNMVRIPLDLCLLNETGDLSFFPDIPIKQDGLQLSSNFNRNIYCGFLKKEILFKNFHTTVFFKELKHGKFSTSKLYG